jgi:antitoxin HigA-1
MVVDAPRPSTVCCGRSPKTLPRKGANRDSRRTGSDAHHLAWVNDHWACSSVIFEDVQPGRILKREVDVRSLSAAALALKLCIAPQRIQEIVAGRRAISPESALRLGRYFDNEPEFWLAMQASYDLAMLRTSIGRRIEAEIEESA